MKAVCDTCTEPCSEFLSAHSELLSCTGAATAAHPIPASETRDHHKALCNPSTEQTQKANPSFMFSYIAGRVRTDIT